MSSQLSFLPAAALVSLLAVAVPHAVAAQDAHAHSAGDTTMLRIPESVRAEHEEILSALQEAVRTRGRVGDAARNLMSVLHPHFVREEQIALPPLGLLKPLSAGNRPSQTFEVKALAMSDSLKAELPTMLKEHVAIRAAVGRLAETAKAARDAKAQRLAEQLSLHARTEEEVLYPAAILVGDVIRSRHH